MKRVLSVVLVLVMMFSLSSMAWAEDATGNLSKEEIKQLLDDTQFDASDGLWSTTPQLSPYAAGQLTQSIQQKALARLNAWRKIAGLPAVSLKQEYSELSQYAALIQAALGTGLYHYPTQPSGMSDEFYQKAHKGSGSSNLAAGMQFPDVVDRLLSDELGKNITSVGHRRWLLNSVMESTGFGYAENLNTPYKRYAAIYAIDNANKKQSIDYTTWPVAGNFPSDTQAFLTNTPWSIQLNAKKYGKLDTKNVCVTLTRGSDGASWVFDGNRDYDVSDTGKYFTVDNTTIGGTVSIIFRPDNVSRYEGAWKVDLQVSKTSAGGSLSLQYTVDFFDMQSYSPVAESVPTISAALKVFDDVTDRHWAASYIDEALHDGAVVGSAPNKYNPEGSVTAYEFATMLLRGSLQESIDTKSVSPWYATVDSLAERYGIWDGVATTNRNSALSRYDMSVMIYNLLGYVGVDAEVASVTSFGDISGSLYQRTVGVCTHYDILQGVTATTFSGESGVTRAQAAAIYCRLKAVLNAV